MAIAALLALTACGGGGSGAGPIASAPTPTPTPAPSPTPTPTPTSTADIQRDIRVAYVGSSVINGVGASSASTSLIGLLSQYLATRFRSVESRTFAANRTGAEFGAYRIQSDLTRTGFVPDYAIVSFTNDDTDPATIKTFQDAIIYQLRQKNPNVVVVLVAVARESDEAERRQNVVPARVAVTSELAATEGAGVLFVDAGAALWDKVINGGQRLGDLLADGFPTDAGYKVYADAIASYLGPRLATQTGGNTSTSAYIAQTNLQDAHLIAVASTTANTCRIASESSEYYVQNGLTCTAGQGFGLTFKGTTFGITRATIGDGGNLTCTVDGGMPTTISFFEAGLNLAALRPVRVFENLANTTHTVACTVDAASPSGSGGTHVIIGSFFASSGKVLAN